MNEFAKMIYEQWRFKGTDENGNDNEVDWGEYGETVEKIYDFLNENIAFELECAINKKVWTVEENAFIAGFSYACKCLSNGKIEFGGGAK